MLQTYTNTVNQLPVWKDNLSFQNLIYSNIALHIVTQKNPEILKIVTLNSVTEYEKWVLFLLEITENLNDEDLSNGIVFINEGEYELRFVYNNDILFRELLKVGDSINNNTNGGYI
jgi:hypothetical protein